MRKQILTYSLVAGSLFLGCNCAMGVSINVPNFSFETPDIADGTTTNTIPDWTRTISGGGFGEISDPAGALLPNGEGSQAARLAPAMVSFPFSSVKLVSASSLLTIADNTTYTLTVAVLVERGQGVISLFANGTSVASTSTLANNPSAFADFTTSFTTAPSGDPRVGLPLTVELRAPGAPDFQFVVQFDNVRVDASPAPEPCAAMMVGVALGAFGMRRPRSAAR